MCNCNDFDYSYSLLITCAYRIEYPKPQYIVKEQSRNTILCDPISKTFKHQPIFPKLNVLLNKSPSIYPPLSIHFPERKVLDSPNPLTKRLRQNCKVIIIRYLHTSIRNRIKSTAFQHVIRTLFIYPLSFVNGTSSFYECAPFLQIERHAPIE